MMDREQFEFFLSEYEGPDFKRISSCLCPLGVFVRRTHPEGGVGLVTWWEKASSKDMNDLPYWAAELRRLVDAGFTDKTQTITLEEVRQLMTRIRRC